MNWGKWIIVAFILFIAFIATLVTVCVRQDVNLVSKTYYQDELEYQSQIIRMENVNLLTTKPVITKSGKNIEITFKQFSEVQQGSLKLVRPSDPSLDKEFKVEATTSPKQFFPVDALGSGMYRAQLRWVMNQKEYFIEEIIFI